LSGREQAQTIVEAVRLGAADYVVKPDDPGGLGEIALDAAIKQAFERNRLVHELTDLRRQLSDDQNEAFIGWSESAAMRQVALIIEQVADNDVMVLIRGESVIEAYVPPRRERRDEIAKLTDFFIAKYSQRYNRPVRSLSEELRERFLTYDWPGNVRELENMIKRFVILHDEQLVLRELSKPRLVANPQPPGQDGRRLSEVAREAALTAERTVIADTLRQVHWNRRKAAQLLGVSYKTLLNKIKETGIERP